jgi:hypothetical protein
MNVLFTVAVNGLIQTRDVDYYHIAGTSKITFVTPPSENSTVTITYFKGRNDTFIDTFGKPLIVSQETFTYTGGTPSFTTLNSIDSVISLDINGLVEDEGVGFEVSGLYEITILGIPAIGSQIGVVYLH